jgi:ATP-dependent DNA helicase RecG
MPDTLILKERIKNTIQIGESHFREFKSALEGPPGKKKPGEKRDRQKIKF